ncbi:hypothetical protein K505DRAFT_320999 [Melanomma pulvis-pyrius CBS 109.77]|uniref:Uncharacterized protein n=1 Tax=Melanomma pulvis-pyrius CBS 109.77 TaxID=1314802 RepID=A0A6A6XVA1_9PLEO|nr:hypothetical protein K505DRAFT_320999 [Melanomma pulvis-pyrius CBS 109.77]
MSKSRLRSTLAAGTRVVLLSAAQKQLLSVRPSLFLMSIHLTLHLVLIIVSLNGNPPKLTIPCLSLVL